MTTSGEGSKAALIGVAAAIVGAASSPVYPRFAANHGILSGSLRASPLQRVPAPYSRMCVRPVGWSGRNLREQSGPPKACIPKLHELERSFTAIAWRYASIAALFAFLCSCKRFGCLSGNRGLRYLHPRRPARQKPARTRQIPSCDQIASPWQCRGSRSAVATTGVGSQQVAAVRRLSASVGVLRPHKLFRQIRPAMQEIRSRASRSDIFLLRF